MSLLEQAISVDQYNRADMNWETEGYAESPARQFIKRSINLQAIDVSGKTILDVGCGTGWFLKECLDKGAREVTGLEPSMYADAARKYVPDAEIIGTTFEDYQTDKKFDLISFIMSTEHIYSIKSALKKANTFLNDGGKALILTADRDRFIGDYNDAVVSCEEIIQGKETVVRRERPNGYGTTIDIVRSLDYWLENIKQAGFTDVVHQAVRVDDALARAEPHKFRIVGMPVFQLFWVKK